MKGAISVGTLLVVCIGVLRRWAAGWSALWFAGVLPL
jgi:hypothetical protein